MKKSYFSDLFFSLLIILAICIICISPIFNLTTAKAEEDIKSYYLINQNTTLIPEGQNIKGNIQLNSSYYVGATGNPDVTINSISYRYVVYNGITGLVQKNALSNKSISNISNPFFVATSKLTATTSDDDILMFFNINDDQTNCRKLQNNTKLDFIAYSESGKYILAKLPDSTIGFVQKKFLTPTIIYTPHPNPVNPDSELTTPNLTPDNPTTNANSTNKATITRIILIVTLCVVVVIVIFLLFKPVGQKRKSVKDDFYDY